MKCEKEKRKTYNPIIQNMIKINMYKCRGKGTDRINRKLNKL